jgi:hypothetical protein
MSLSGTLAGRLLKKNVEAAAGMLGLARNQIVTEGTTRFSANCLHKGLRYPMDQVKVYAFS